MPLTPLSLSGIFPNYYFFEQASLDAWIGQHVNMVTKFHTRLYIELISGKSVVVKTLEP